MLILLRKGNRCILQILFQLFALTGQFFVPFGCFVKPCTQFGFLAICRLDILLKPRSFGYSTRRRSFVGFGFVMGFFQCFFQHCFFLIQRRFLLLDFVQLLLHAAQCLPLFFLILIASSICGHDAR